MEEKSVNTDKIDKSGENKTESASIASVNDDTEAGSDEKPGDTAVQHSVEPPSNFTDSSTVTSSSPPSSTSSSPVKSFKMLRLRKGPTEELGIIISKKRNPNKGTTGYVIAHIEPDGLINK